MKDWVYWNGQQSKKERKKERINKCRTHSRLNFTNKTIEEGQFSVLCKCKREQQQQQQQQEEEEETKRIKSNDDFLPSGVCFPSNVKKASNRASCSDKMAR